MSKITVDPKCALLAEGVAGRPRLWGRQHPLQRKQFGGSHSGRLIEDWFESRDATPTTTLTTKGD